MFFAKFSILPEDFKAISILDGRAKISDFILFSSKIEVLSKTSAKYTAKILSKTT